MTAAATVWLDLTGLLHAPGARPTGIPRVIASLLGHWLRAGPPNLRFCAIRPVERALVEVAAPQRPGRPGSALFRRAAGLLPAGARAGLRRLAYRLARPLARLRTRPLTLTPADLLVSLGGTWIVHDGAAVVRACKRRMGFRHAAFVHDLIPLSHPQFYPPTFAPTFRAWTTDTLSAADLILVNSRHTRGDVLAFCAAHSLPPPPVAVVRLGDDFAGDEARPPAGLDGARPFVLSVGTVEARKNHALLYHVWRRLAQERGDATPLLVFAGRPGWRTADLLDLAAHDPLTRARIVLLGDADDAELSWLYRRCLFTLYPSHYEGWGLPIGESLAAGKYVIASSAASMPEVGGDLVGLHDPGDLSTCMALVRQALDADWRSRHEARIRREYRPTTWGDFARQVGEVLHRQFGVPAAPPPNEVRRAAG